MLALGLFDIIFKKTLFTTFRSGLSPKDKAVARSMRILMEDHLYWILMVERYVHTEARHLKDLIRKLHSVSIFKKSVLNNLKTSVVCFD